MSVVEAPKHGRALTDGLEPLDKNYVLVHGNDLPGHWLLDVLCQLSPTNQTGFSCIPAAYVTGVLEDPSNPGSPAPVGSSRVFKIEGRFQEYPARNPATMNWREPNLSTLFGGGGASEGKAVSSHECFKFRWIRSKTCKHFKNLAAKDEVP